MNQGLKTIKEDTVSGFPIISSAVGSGCIPSQLEYQVHSKLLGKLYLFQGHSPGCAFFFFFKSELLSQEGGSRRVERQRQKRSGGYFRPCFSKPSTSELQDRPSCCETLGQLLRSEDKQHSSSSPGGYPRPCAFQHFPGPVMIQKPGISALPAAVYTVVVLWSLCS